MPWRLRLCALAVGENGIRSRKISKFDCEHPTITTIRDKLPISSPREIQNPETTEIIPTPTNGNVNASDPHPMHITPRNIPATI
jgi:hypothetical protein